MKKTIKALKLSIVFLLTISSFIACDKDFNVIESDVLGKGNANFTTNDTVYPIVAYNKKLDSLQINNLASNLLGVFNDPAYGQTTASVITQIIPTSISPNFGTTPVIDSVVLSIPYYSTVTGVDGDGNSTYTLDSLYGDSSKPTKLTIYQNNYFLRDFDPNTTDNSAQNYFSNASSSKNTALNGTQNISFDDHIGELFYDDEFKPSASATVIKTGTGDDEVETRSVPALRIALKNDETNTNFWTRTIIEKQDDAVLSSTNNFKDYFRGLYFKTEAIDNDGSMVLMDFASSAASITIYFTNGETDSRTQSTYVLNFSGNRLNTFINDYNKVTFPTNPDKNLGDEELFLKGIEGSMTVVDLFEGELEYEDKDGNISLIPAIDHFKKTYRETDDNGGYIEDNTTGDFVLKKLINEAHLAIYEDELINTNGDDDFHKYDRIYAYDTKNSISTIDYQIDPTENTQNAFSSKVISLSQRDTTSGKYKIRLTEHLNNILLRDSTNTQIGLVLSTNVNYATNAQILNSNDDVTAIPAAAILTPRGTIIHGSNENVDDTKRMKLKIFFTEPN